jgi:hypothetical protein
MTAVDAYTRDVLMEAECVRERNGVWHIVLGDGNADFQPILCGERDGSGINLPGPSRWGEPTCPSCRFASGEEGQR